MKTTNSDAFLKSYKAVIMLASMFLAASSATAQTKVYANTQANTTTGGVLLGGLLGGGSGSVANPGNAVLVTGSADAGDLQNEYSTLSLSSQNGGLLGISLSVAPAATQYLQFPNAVKSGTPIFIKLSTSAGLLGLNALGLLGNISAGTFTGTAANPTSTTQATTTGSGSTGLVTLLAGVGIDEIQINAPANGANGVYVTLSGLLSVSAGTTIAGSSINLYHAYYYDSTAAGCPAPIDYADGTGAVGGLANLATGLLSSFTNPANAIDGNDATSTTISVASVANTAYYTAILNTPAKAGDSVRVLLNNPNQGLLDLSVLGNNISIEAYNGDTLKYAVPLSNAALIDLQLFPGSTSVNVITAAIPANFDRIELSFGNVNNLSLANVNALLGNGTINLYEMGIAVAAPVLTASQATQYAYAGNADTLHAAQNAESDAVVWSEAATDATFATLTKDSIIAGTVAGTYNFYALSSRNGCTSASDTSKMILHVIPNPNLNSPANGSVNVPYSSNVDAASTPTGLPVTPSYTYALASGSTLPAGLTLNPDGTITGTPAEIAAGQSFSVIVYDNANNLPVGTYTETISILAGTLPITLIPDSFTATPDDNKNVVLNWATATEINTLRFDVQRSTDGSDFATIGSVNAAGNSATEQTYSYTDMNAFGLIYYRLKIVDMDSTSVYSNIVSININKQNSSDIIYPNPATTNINIAGNASLISIFDVSGRLVLTTNTTTHIDVQNLATGVYLVTIKQQNGTIVKRKFIKE